MTCEVGFLGFGRMAQAISEGLNKSGKMPYSRQAASALRTDKLQSLADTRGFVVAVDNRNLLSLSPAVIIAVKPHQVQNALAKAGPAVRGQLFISIAAGISLAELQAWLPDGTRVIRVIPNLPAQVGRGLTLVCAPEGTRPDDLKLTRYIFESVGTVTELPESLFDEGTAVSGSGPAYFFLVMEAMVRGAVRLGLPWDLAKKMVLQTARGAAETALVKDDLSLADLRDQVTSPGGTTAEALYVLEQGGLTALFQEALEAASVKAKKLK
ncbi:MAG: pyrroline-5-carboxylate reductase [Deltaproteobacteria bacterium]|jgi:pyrroline-5-carboxylate reductase|nr:pyrroline-5-carboxylate reductase [Deltaproteobacteria bacterium]